MGSTAQNLTEKRNNPDYLNCIAVGDALRILGEGLRHYTEQKVKELHKLLLTKLAGASCNCPCTPGASLCCSTLTTPGKRCRHKCSPGVKHCSHNCKWGKELEKLHNNKKKKHIPFYQSDSTLWHDPTNGYWEIAKVFMSDLGSKWRDVKDPASTDLTGLLNLLIFCNHFNTQPNLLKSVRKVRNDWAHAPNHMFSESEKQAAFVEIEKLMNDVELLSCKEVQDCRSGIEETRNGDASFLQERDLLVLKELTRHNELRKEKDTERERRELMEMIEKIEFILSSSNNYHPPQSYSSDNHFKAGDTVCVATIFIINLFMLFFNCFRKMFPWLLLVGLLISHVGDHSVFVSNFGCYRTDNEVKGFDKFREFDFTAHLSYKRENFFGRSWFFRELDEIFERFKAPVGVLITGDPGSGKSALIAQLICSSFYSLAINNNIIGYHFCDYSEKEKRDGARFVRNLVHQIGNKIPKYAELVMNKEELRTELGHCERDPTACFLTTIAGPLRELRIEGDDYKYIVIDALDECVEKDGESSAILDILHYKMKYFPPWLKIIMSSRNGTTVTSKVPRTVRRMSLNPADERNIEDIRSYILRYLRKRSSFMNKLWKAISPLKDALPEIINELTKRAEGNFLFVKTVLQNNLDTDGTINLNSLPNSLDDTYYQIFQRYFIKEDFNRYEILFEIILASGSLHETEVFEILKSQNQGKEMHDIVEHVSSLLHFGHDGIVNIYHQSFAEWLMNNDKRVRGFSIQKTRGHEYIANYLVDRIVGSNHTITFNELSRLCIHVLYSGGPSDYHEKILKLLNVSKIRHPQNGKFILHDLARRENGSRLLEIFLPSFTSVDITDQEGKTPAYYAASAGSIKSSKLFLDKGSCPNCILNNVSSLDAITAVIQMKGYEGLSIMHVATYNGHTEVIDMLLKHDASFIKFSKNLPSLLNVAAEKGHFDIVKLLYNYGAEADIISLHHAAARNNILVVDFLLRTAGVKDECLECKPLQTVSHIGEADKSFYDIHRMFCETALHAAVSKRHINITKLLLQFGNSALECKHHSGKTPLMHAAEQNDTEVVELLLKNGANVEEKCGYEILLSLDKKQQTSRGFRSFQGKRFLYTMYREETSCACGNKVLHLCAKYGLWHMAKYLINNWNASVLDKNCKGETVWKIANVSHNEDFIYYVNRMLLNLDTNPVSRHQMSITKYQRRTLEKLLRKFFMRTKPYQSSFQCDSTFEGMSPLHIAALMGVDMLKRVYRKAHEIAPSLPLNCTNKHWITPRYLAYFYDSIHALTDENSKRSKQTPHKNEYTKTMLQYPDREAEFHLIYNYFYHSPTAEANVLTYKSLTKLDDFDVTNCPGFYDVLPESKHLHAKPYCFQTPSKREREEDDENRDDTRSALQKMKYCKARHESFCVCFYEIEQRIMFEQYAQDCYCPVVMRELQRWFTNSPKRHGRINQFIAERMGWKHLALNDEIQRWPVYFLYKKLKNEYQSYKYLDVLNEGFKIDDDDIDDDDDEDD